MLRKEVEFKILKSKDDLQKHYQLRYWWYVEKKSWEIGSDFFEMDEFDEFSVHFGGLKGENLLVTARIIEGIKIDLPIWKFTNHRERNSVEISRMIINKKEKLGVPAFLLIRGVYLEMLKYVMEKKINYVYAIVRCSQLRGNRLQRRNFILKDILGSPFLYKSKLFVPMGANIKSVIENLSLSI